MSGKSVPTKHTRVAQHIWVYEPGGRVYTVGPDEGATFARWRDTEAIPGQLHVAVFMNEIFKIQSPKYETEPLRYLGTWENRIELYALPAWTLHDIPAAQPYLSQVQEFDEIFDGQLNNEGGATDGPAGGPRHTVAYRQLMLPLRQME